MRFEIWQASKIAKRDNKYLYIIRTSTGKPATMTREQLIVLKNNNMIPSSVIALQISKGEGQPKIVNINTSGNRFKILTV